MRLLKKAGCVVMLAAAIGWLVSDGRAYAQITPQGVSQVTDTPKGDVSQTVSDQTVTARIRQNLDEDTSLSERSKTVRIITVNGEVTLRGQVNTASERQRVEDKTHDAIGVTRVINQLDVSP